MTPSGPRRRALLLGLPAVALGASGCYDDFRDRPRSTFSDDLRSLETLRVVDARHPLLAMTRYGTYDAEQPVALAPADEPFACSLFLASGGPRGPLFGRNFDWDDHPALVLTTRPPNGPATISMVDISYLGVDRAAALRAPTDRAVGQKLLDAVRIPFDGVNEHGLAVGLASLRSPVRPPELPGRPTVGSVRVQRLALDKARTVTEAVEVFKSYNLDFADSPPLHYLLADRTGEAAVVEFAEGEVNAVPGADTWHAMENFALTGTPDGERTEHRRYRTIAEKLRATGGKLDVDGAMALLENVRQPHTRWSAVYELDNGVMHYSLGRDYSRRRTVRFA